MHIFTVIRIYVYLDVSLTQRTGNPCPLPAALVGPTPSFIAPKWLAKDEELLYGDDDHTQQ